MESRITLQARRFHYDNQHVYSLLVRFAREAREAGFRRIGIELLWNRMRWELLLLTDDDSGYKLNNNYKPFYARLIMDQEPDLRGIFEIRRLKAVA